MICTKYHVVPSSKFVECTPFSYSTKKDGRVVLRTNGRGRGSRLRSVLLISKGFLVLNIHTLLSFGISLHIYKERLSKVENSFKT